MCTATYLAPRLRIYLPHFTHAGELSPRYVIAKEKGGPVRRQYGARMWVLKLRREDPRQSRFRVRSCGAAIEPQTHLRGGLMLHKRPPGIQAENTKHRKKLTCRSWTDTNSLYRVYGRKKNLLRETAAKVVMFEQIATLDTHEGTATHNQIPSNQRLIAKMRL